MRRSASKDILSVRTLGIVCANLAAFGYVQDATAQQTATAKININVRQAMNTQSRIVTTLRAGTEVEILEQVGEYSRIRTADGREGFLRTRYLDVAAAPAASPPAPEAPPASAVATPPPEVPPAEPAPAAVASTEPEPAAASGATQLEPLEVTGSRITRAEMESALPVSIITRDQLVNAGVTTVADVVRHSTFNSFGSYSQISGSSFEGAALVDLRGLGSSRTLVLLNGHRVATAPATQGAGVDLNAIPLAAVERVEILQDGASAIYGSDAVAGVVNVILRRDFNAAEVTVGAGWPSAKGGDEEAASFVGGMSNAGNRLMFGATMTSKGIIWLRDRDYSKASPGDSVNFSTVSGINEAGNTVFNETFTDAFDAPAGACEAPGLARYTDDAGVVIGVPGIPICTFDFTSYAADTRALRTSSLFASFTHEMNPDWDFNLESVYARSKAFGRFAPAPDLLFLDAANPNNPYGENIYIYHRYISLGPRDDYSSSDVFSVFASFKGELGPGRLEPGVAYSVSNMDSYGYNYVLNSVAAAAAESGDYNPFALPGGSPETLSSMKVTINRRGQTDAREVFANYALPLIALPGGAIQNVTGAEYREERFYDNYDSQSEAGTVGGSAGNSSFGERSAWAAYNETLFPILDTLEADLALRYDSYDDVGSKFTPKLSVRFSPSRAFVLRASAGRGFRAPLLSELNAKDQSDAPVARDFTACRSNGVADVDCPEGQFDNFLIRANPNLEPEVSTQYGAGFVLQPTDWLDASLDYWNIKIEEAIATPTLQELIVREANGQPLTPGAFINRTGTGGIDPLDAGFVTTFNYQEITTDGVDLSVNGNFVTAGAGSLRPKLQLSYILNISSDDGVLPPQDGAGRAATNTGAAQGPQYRVYATVDWALANFGATWSTVHIPGTFQSDVSDPADPLRTLGTGHVKANTRHDVQLRFDHPWQGTITVGCRDIFDRGPSLNETLDSPYYAQGLYDPTGRIPYARYSQRF